MESDKQLAWTYLDTRGSDKFKDMLYEKIYQHKEWTPVNGEPPVPVTRDDLDDFDHFDLIRSLMKQCKSPRFPFPNRTGHDMPYEAPHELPKGLHRGTPPRDPGAYLDAIDVLINSSNRDGGHRYNGRRGQFTGGFTTPTYIYDDVLENLVNWIAEHIKEEKIKMPQRTLSPAASDKWKGPSARYDTQYQEELKQALCAGMGTDPQNIKEDFLLLFRDLANRHIFLTYEVSRRFNAMYNNFSQRGFLYTLASHFEPIIFQAAQEEGKSARGHLLRGTIQSENAKLRSKILSALSRGNFNTLLTPDDAYKIGYVLRKEGRLERYKHALSLGPIPTPPERMFNQLNVDSILAESLPSETGETALPAQALSREIRGISITLQPEDGSHARISESGTAYSVDLRQGSDTAHFTLELPAGFSAEALLDSTAQRLARLKAEAIGVHSTQHAMREAANQRNR